MRRVHAAVPIAELAALDGDSWRSRPGGRARCAEEEPPADVRERSVEELAAEEDEALEAIVEEDAGGRRRRGAAAAASAAPARGAVAGGDGRRRPGHARLRRRRPRPAARRRLRRRRARSRPRPRRSPTFARARGDRPVVAHDWKTIAAADDEPAPTPPLAHDTLVAAYLIDPARRGYPLEELATEVGPCGEASTATIPPGSPSAPSSRARSPSASSCGWRRTGSTELLHDVELPLVDVLVEMERAGVKLDVERLREISARLGAQADELERRVWELAGEEFTIGSPQQLAHDPVREARPVAQAARENRLLHRRARAPGDPLRARDHPGGRGVARADEAQVDLPRRVPRADRRGRPAAHDVQPGDGHDRPPVEHEPEPPEHPDPHRAGPRDPRLLRRRAGHEADLAPTTRRSSCGCSPTSPARTC